MITVFNEEFQNVLEALQSIATKIDAETRLEQYRQDTEAERTRQLEAAVDRANDDCAEFRRNDPNRGRREEEYYQTLLDDVTREYRHRAEGKVKYDPARRMPAEYSILEAIKKLQQDWYISPDAFSLVVDCLQNIPAPNFDEDTLDAIRRGYTAHDEASADKAIAKAKKDREFEAKKKAEEIELKRLVQLTEERDRVQAMIEQQQSPHKRLKEIEKELATVGSKEKSE